MTKKFESKKFTALAVGLLGSLIAAGLGWLIALVGLDGQPELQEQVLELSKALAALIVAAVASYVVGQGVADRGKEAEKVKLERDREQRVHEQEIAKGRS